MTNKKFSTHWNKSGQPGKQRKFRYNAPLHIRQKLVHVHLSAELRKKYGTRCVQIRVGDKAKIMRGQFAKRDGKVERVFLKRERVIITGIENIKKDGTKLPVQLHPSNLLIIDLNLEDKKRKQKLESHLKDPTPKSEKVVKKASKTKSKG
ncbi:MAG: 50S ribosomal protein L24 [Candidatus Woesearchaeota archaeon]|jgi:large subunit ribosomal protein L24